MFRGLDIEFFGGKIQKNHRNLAIFLNTSNQKMELHHLASDVSHSVSQGSKKNHESVHVDSGRNDENELPQVAQFFNEIFDLDVDSIAARNC